MLCHWMLWDGLIGRGVIVWLIAFQRTEISMGKVHEDWEISSDTILMTLLFYRYSSLLFPRSHGNGRKELLSTSNRRLPLNYLFLLWIGDCYKKYSQQYNNPSLELLKIKIPALLMVGFLIPSAQSIEHSAMWCKNAEWINWKGDELDCMKSGQLVWQRAVLTDM